ncbi:CobQ/CobB/MinD/ParA family nucleotide binding protein [Kitasatospora sp. SolWspMP-SS2h]|uniref:KGGVGR-motif variant AAA ATPase n=1 Tax=Kitasatospora sp. SolWspMP-SS2h TaxID=1305729 RepID=UPI000DB9AF60|nr:AAA family ATPase [Kitasatospora sp. SolWspMP-SS2h]RAJ31196.1 CobQ/CobB/MinD/ParA family nucleotide binding protein [Kitasatospora sp. SolWspMP-SS2h]
MNLSSEPIRFDHVRGLALVTAREVAATGIDVLIVRDLLGRITLLIDDREQAPDEDSLLAWGESLKQALGPYVSGQGIALGSTLFQATALFDSSRVLNEITYVPTASQGNIRWLENTVVGEDWTRVSEVPEPSIERVPKVTLYGFKGGVGRSTATAVLARHLADSGKRVLVVDLDLESPGSGPLLLTMEETPQFGLVDQLVESALGNANGLDLVAPASHYTPTRGELWVAPARGRGIPGTPYSYVEKLNRIYTDSPTEDDTDFANRLAEAITACELAMTEAVGAPEVVLLDSRAGIHDIAAVAISRLCDVALLFGADNAHTWAGYSDLFTAWRDSGQAPTVRERLHMVASMVPDTPSRPKDSYLEEFRDHSWSCFSVLYDNEVTDGSSPLPNEAFNPSPEDDSAPHSPIPILFSLDLIGLDSIATPDWPSRGYIQTAYDEFLKTTTHLIFPEGSS